MDTTRDGSTLFARVIGGPVAFTPRQGKAVEINALWFNALKLMKEDAKAKLVEKDGQAHGWADMGKDSLRFADWFDEHLRGLKAN